MIRSIAIAAALLASASAAQAQTITLGEANKLGFSDNGNANLLLAEGPFHLAQAATLNNISFWVTRGSGHLVLGVYTSGPNNDCAGGSLIAQTSSFTPTSNSWNTKAPTASVVLSPGNYCLAYLPSSNSLSFLKGMASGVLDRWYSQPFGTGQMPGTFSSSPSGPDGFHWSIYASLTAAGQTPVGVTFNPTSATTLDNVAAGTALSSILVQTSDSNAFSGSLSIVSQTAAGMTSLSSASLPSKVQVASINSSDDGAQSVTVQACENGVCKQGTLGITVNPSATATLSLSFSPSSPSIPPNAAIGTVVSTATARWSDGSQFTGTLGFGPPYNDDAGTFRLSGNNIVVNADISGDAGTGQNITVVATQ